MPALLKNNGVHIGGFTEGFALTLANSAPGPNRDDWNLRKKYTPMYRRHAGLWSTSILADRVQRSDGKSRRQAQLAAAYRVSAVATAR
ncbi:MAG: hypothetical protein Hals2KO_04780 [Halioglobus sp.]